MRDIQIGDFVFPGARVHLGSISFLMLLRPKHNDITAQGFPINFPRLCCGRIDFPNDEEREKDGAAAFLKGAIDDYKSFGVTIQRAFAKASKRLDLKRLRTGLYTPKTNGKAERVIQTSL
jgi:hypothetical protein